MAGYNLGEARGKIILETDFTSLSEAEKQLGGFKKNASQTGDATKDAFQKTSTAATAGGAAIVAGFAVAVKAASDFEFQLDAVQAVSGATAEEMGLIREAALRIGKDTAYSASEAALAMEELVKAGISTEDVLNGAADAAVALAAAGGVDLPTAAAIAANAMNQFNLGAEDLVKVTDLVAGAANASAIDVNEFAYSLSQVGAVANLAGLSFEDTATAIAAMGNAGIKGSDAGTSLKTMLMNLQPSTKKQAEAMQELGIITEDGANQFYTAEGRLKSLGEISDVLRGALEGMTDAQKQATLEVLFGSDAIRGAAVIANEGADGLAALNEQMLKVSAADVAATRMDNLKGSVEGLMGSLETLWIQIGERLIPILTAAADKLSEIIDWFSAIDPAAQAAITGTVGVVGAMALILGIGTKVVLALVEYRSTLLLATGATTLFGSAGAIAVAKTKLLAGAVAILNSALLANPIVRVVAIVLALVTAFAAMIKASEDLRKAFQPVAAALERSFEQLRPTIEKIEGVFSQLVETFVRAVMPVVEKVAGLLAKLLVPAAELLGKVIENQGKLFAAWADVMVAVWTPILEGVAWLLGVVVDALDWFMTAVETVFKGVTGQLEDNGSEWSNWYYQTVKPVVEKMIAIMKPLAEAIIQGWQQAQDAVRPVVEWFNRDVGPKIQAAWELLQKKAGELGEGIARSWEAMQPAISAVVTWMRDAAVARLTNDIRVLVAAFEAMRDGVAAAWTDARARVEPVYNWFKDSVVPPLISTARSAGDAWRAFSDRAAEAWQNIQDRVQPVYEWLTGTAFPQVREQIQPILDKLVELRDKFAEAWETIQARVQPIIDKFTNEVIPRLVGIYETLRAKVDEVATKIGDAWQSIQDRLTPIAEALGRLVGTLQDLFGRFFSSGGDGKSAGPEQAAQPTVSTWERISAAITFAVDVIVAILDILIGAIDLAIRTFDTMALAVSSVMNTVRTIVSTVTQFLSALFRGEWAAMPNIVKNAWQSLPDGVRVPLEGAYNLVRTIQSRIQAIFSGAASWLFSAGRTIIDGLVNGISSAIDRVRSTLQSVTNLIPDWKGPAERDRVLLEPNGRLIMQSLINGLKSETGNLHGMLGGLTDSIPLSVTQDIDAVVAGGRGSAGREINVTLNYTATGTVQDSREDVITMLGHATEVVRAQLV